MIWWEKEKSRIMPVQMDNLRGLLGIRRVDKVPNPRIRQLCGITMGMDKKIDEGVLRWLGHVERMRMTGLLRGSVGECAGRPWKRWIDIMKDCLKKRGLDVRQARRMCMGHCLGDDPLTLTDATVVSCQSCMKPLKGGSPSVSNSTT